MTEDEKQKRLLKTIIIGLSALIVFYLISLIPSDPKLPHDWPNNRSQQAKKTDVTERSYKLDIGPETCTEIESAKFVGRLVFTKKLPGRKISEVGAWKYQNDNVFFFSVLYEDVDGTEKEGYMAVEKATCKTVIMPTSKPPKD